LSAKLELTFFFQKEIIAEAEKAKAKNFLMA
jgi:hypothetical protein